MTAAPPPAPKTAAQRQAKYRNSLPRKGLERITLVVSTTTAQLLRDLSRDHDEPLARVLELGTLVAQRELASRTARR